MTKEHKHGSPWDRGGADSYYGRARRPHKYVSAPLPGNPGSMVAEYRLTEAEVADYQAGYDENEEEGNKKDWG